MTGGASTAGREREADAVDPRWRGLCRIGGATSLATALAYLVALAVYAPAMTEAPAPSTVAEWFTLLQDDPVTGLFYLGLTDILIVILFIPLSMALRAVLEQVSKTWTAIATPVALVGVAVYLVANMSFSMLSLSSDYAAATTDADRAAILAAGHAIISLTKGTGGAAGLSLMWLGGLIFSILMFRSKELGRAVAWIGVLAFSLLVPAFLFAGYTYGISAGIGAALALVTSVGGGLLSLAWYILVGLKLLQLGRRAGKPPPHQQWRDAGGLSDRAGATGQGAGVA